MAEATPSPTVQHYILRDPYAQFLGISIDEIGLGFARVSMQVTEKHTNFHGSVHGGIIFTLADIAFSAACNAYGQTAVGLNVDISYLQAGTIGSLITAEARELSLNGPIVLYELSIKQNDTLIAQCQAMSYRKRDRFAD